MISLGSCIPNTTQHLRERFAELQEAYEELRGFAAGMDAQSAKYVFDFLAGYRLPPGERERVVASL